MSRRLTSLVLVAVCCLCGASGCADTATRLGNLAARPFKKTTEQEFGIKTPKDRVEDLRELAKTAKKQTLAEQEHAVAKLANDFEREHDGWVRREILRALSAYPQPAAGAVLVRALSDPEVETRRVACAGLGARGDDIAVRELARVLGSDTNEDVRLAAVEALGATGQQAALSPLVEALAEADPAMQAQAQQALATASGRDYGGNLEAWREYAQNGKTGAAEVSFAEKLRRTFY